MKILLSMLILAGIFAIAVSAARAQEINEGSQPYCGYGNIGAQYVDANGHTWQCRYFGGGYQNPANYGWRMVS